MSAAARNTARRLAVLALALALAGVTGAGCVALHQGNLYAADRNAVFVGYFGNETFYRDVEFDLTDQVVAEILSSPGLHLSSKADAEVVLTGRVLNVRQHVLSENPNQTPTSSNTSITVEVVLTDARTGEVIRKQKLSQQGQFVPALGEDIQTARRQAYHFLARDIVRVLEEDF
ncbi:MAG TPA: LPS assembly lipoprotein LptE [Planctomycetota bacterium]|nr:LPS assembly lipoprotein LptE [Planctomycetota bacterium]